MRTDLKDQIARQRRTAGAVLIGVFGLTIAAFAAAPSRQSSLDEWRNLTGPEAAPPLVWVKGDATRIFFETATNVVAFRSGWARPRVPVAGYKASLAQLKLDGKPATVPRLGRGWRQAAVIAGREWRQLATNLLTVLTPAKPGHGIYYQGLQADRLLYRDREGHPQSATIGEQPPEVVVDRHYSLEETLELVANLADDTLSLEYAQQPLLLLMAQSSSRRWPGLLLLDRKQHHCVWLTPAALGDADRGFSLAVTGEGLASLILESHGYALLKAPFSSAARLADLAVESVVRFLRFPFPRPGGPPGPLHSSRGMDLAKWESWLDRYTGTRRREGSLKLLLDGEQFYPRLKQAFTEATNHIRLEVYIFDNDDCAVETANQLREKAAEGVEVQVILDRMGSLAAGTVPPATPLPDGFVSPGSILSYLKNDSSVRVRPFLNPWFSADHTKLYLVDGVRAWVGGMNVGREYRYEWHDLMVELRGPVVQLLEQEFRQSWAHEGPFGDLAYFAATATRPREAPSGSDSNEWSQVRLLPSRTAWKPFSSAVAGAIAQAQDYLYLENPYLFDKRVIVGLARARQRGVDVRVVLPRVNDFKTGARSNLVVANYLWQHGVRVYFYPGMTHVKALLADGWACVGSGNLNHLSLRLDQEQNIASSDARFSDQLKRDLFEKDFTCSTEITQPIIVDWSDMLADLLIEGF